MDSLAVKPVPIRLYSYDYDGELKVRGIPRAEPAEVIRLLFEPEGVSPSDLAKWKVDHANIVKLPWLKAQLDLHGGDNPTSLTKDECLKRLRDRALRPDTGRHQQEFHDLATLEEKLNYDADMFMEVYFGSRDTLLEPVPFMGVNFDVVLEAVSRVPGLKSRNVGRDYHKMLWIGWDELLVRNACDRYMDVARINLEARRKIQRKYHADLAKRRKEKQQEKGRSTRTDDSLS
ncbi:hypothetical protein UCREL1_176 [Eutypa lata UCREL1]|uniref:Uncharacterized protein n=1 Tax=Eutypa lata (strain UCR-EL1) TaxID=1287681 RepID=M7U1F5_EUTLA|nr:hypothetical protein UCREL1_176 [Eutypa lata UCREL1]